MNRSPHTACVLLLSALLIILLAVPAGAHAVGVPGSGKSLSEKNQARIPGQYIVVLKDSVGRTGEVARDQTKGRAAELEIVYHYALNGYSAELSSDALKRVRRDPRVQYVTPDHRVEIEAQTVPFGISRVGATANSTADIDGKDDQRVDVDIAIIDTGVDYTHPDLNVYKRAKCLASSCTEGAGTDEYGHGTHVAGTAGAIDNGIGVVGVAPGARLWAAQVLNKDGSGTEAWVIAGVDWVTAHATEIEVANMSLGCLCPYPALEESIETSIENGVVYVVAAGNEAVNASNASPAHFDSVITVSAMVDYDGKLGGEGAQLNSECAPEVAGNRTGRGRDDYLAHFSNFGEDVDVAAPGVCVESTLPMIQQKIPGTEYGRLSGTSMASPHVAGAAALLATQSNPDDAADVAAIRETLKDQGNQSWLDIWSTSTGETKPDTVSEPLIDAGPPGPKAYTTMSSAIRYTTAKLNGGLNPEGKATSYRFEYGTTASYGSVVPGSYTSAGSGQRDVAVSAEVEGLGTETSYHYRLVARDDQTGQLSYGEDRVFHTRSTAMTTQAMALGARSATLEGVLNPAGLASTYQFEYGPTSAYGTAAQPSPKSVGAGTDDIEVSEPISGLQPNSVYHFRLVRHTGSGSFYGEDKIFKTTSFAFRASGEGGTVSATPSESFSFGFQGVQLTCFGSQFSLSVAKWMDSVVPSSMPDSTCIPFGTSRPWKMNGCRFEFHPEVASGSIYRGTVDIGPGGCGPMTVDLGPSWCTVYIPAQRGLNATFGNSGEGANQFVYARITEEAMAITIKEFVCGPKGTFNTGLLWGTWELKAKNAAGSPMGFSIAKYPEVVTQPPTNVGATSATMRGSVETLGLTTNYGIEYGTTTAYGNEIGHSAPPGSGTVQVNEAVSGLAMNTTYHYRAVAVNSEGRFDGLDQVFTTTDGVPKASTGEATSLTTTGATLGATVTPRGLTTSYQIQYVDEDQHRISGWGSAKSVPASPKSVGAGTEPVEVSEALSGLEPATTYRYRVVSSSATGNATGDERTFKTLRPHPIALKGDPYPASVKGEQQTSLVFAAGSGFGGIACTSATFSGPSLSGPQSSLALSTAYSGCDDSFGRKVTIAMNGCEFTLNLLNGASPFPGTMGVACAKAGEAIEYKVQGGSGSTVCTVAVKAQAGTSSASVTNVGSGANRGATVALNLSGLVSTTSGGYFNCGVSNGTHNDGTLEGSLKLLGNGPAGEARALFVGGQLSSGTFITGQQSEDPQKAPRVSAESFPRWISGSFSAPLTFTAGEGFGGITCGSTYLDGGTSADSQSLGLRLETSGCMDSFGRVADVAVNGCSFAVGVLNSGPPYAGNLGISCAKAGEALEFKIKDGSGATVCTVAVAPQSGVSGIGLTNSGTGAERGVGVGFNVTALASTTSGGYFNCGVSNGSHASGTLTGNVQLRAF